MKDIVLMSTADWAHPFWTNKQHTAQTLAKLGYRVFYIDTLGTRQVRLGQKKDIKRIFQRLKRIVSKPKEVEKNIFVWSPCVLPPSSNRFLQLANKCLFNILLTGWLRYFAFSKRPIFWTYNPLSLLYITPKAYSTFIYHCVDNIAEQPGAFRNLIEQQEAALFQQADLVFVTSRELEARAVKLSSRDSSNAYLSSRGPELVEGSAGSTQTIFYYPNVVDFDHFNQACSDISLPDDLASIPQPRAMFIGAISAYKINLPLLRDVAIKLPQVSFVLIGELGEGDPDTSIDELLALPNVYHLGSRAYSDLPNYLKGADVCLIPANVNEYTKSMFPMKFFEYLAAGKPIVATDIPAIIEFHDAYYQASNADEYAEKITQAIAHYSNEQKQAGLNLAGQYTYISRTQKMLVHFSQSY